jgi:hypothetical protein
VSDIVQRFRSDLAALGVKPGMSSSDVNVHASVDLDVSGALAILSEIERLRGIIRSCQHGTEITYLGEGEVIGLYRPNKE